MEQLNVASSRSHSLNGVLTGLMALCLGLITSSPAFAANHPNSGLRDGDVNTLDYVVNTDWDYDDSNVTQVANPSQKMDRQYIESVIRITARSIFTMTEGLHRLGKVYVYKNAKYGDNVDIRILNTDGRSCGVLGHWRKLGGTTFNHVAMDNKPETIDELGKVIAHELGHYTYGLLDEYVEAGRALEVPSQPSMIDTPKDSIMNDHTQFLSLSSPADYNDAEKRQTAQARVYGAPAVFTGGSAWDVLVRQPDSDPEGAKDFGRSFFEAFRNVDPNRSLTRPSEGFDAKLEIIFVPNPIARNVILLDLAMPETNVDSALTAAKALIEQAPEDTQLAIVAFPSAGDGLVHDFAAGNADGKQGLQAAISKLSATTGSFDSAAAFSRAETLIKGARQEGELGSVYYLGATGITLSADTVNSLVKERIVIDLTAIAGANLKAQSTQDAQQADDNTVQLDEVASMTGGVYNVAKTGVEAAKEATEAAAESGSNPNAVVQFKNAPRFAAKGSFDTQFRLASSKVDGGAIIEIYFDPTDLKKLSFSLVGPNGARYSPENHPEEITYELDAAEGVAEFTIAETMDDRSGIWSLEVNASDSTIEGVEIGVATKSSMKLVGSVESIGSRKVLRAVVGGEKRVNGAKVVANIFDSDGKQILGNVVLKDDGISPDSRAGDGEYAVELTGKLQNGDYSAEIRVATEGNARTSAMGALIKGTLLKESPIEDFERMDVVEFMVSPAKTKNNSGNTGKKGGGCSIGSDGGAPNLFFLIMVAGLLIAMRRKSYASSKID